MYELKKLIPDPSLVPLLPTEELAGKLLSVLRERKDTRTFHRTNELATLFPQAHARYGDSAADPWTAPAGALRAEVSLAFAEAWAWLTGQGLLVPSPEQSNDWMVLSRRARSFESEAVFADYRKSRLLPKELLLPPLSERVWLDFMRGEYDSAVFQAFKAVEVAVRKAAKLGDELVGTKLMRRAFDPKGGPLTDLSADEGEKEALSSLFAGSIGFYKNPQSHRDVNLEDPAEAIELILLANHLIRLVQARGTPEKS